MSFPFCVTRRRYSRPLWVMTSSLRAPSNASLGTFAGVEGRCGAMAGFIMLRTIIIITVNVNGSQMKFHYYYQNLIRE